MARVTDIKRYPFQLFMHLFVWATFYGIMLYPIVLEGRSLPSGTIARLFAATALFYLNYFFLVPKLLLKKDIYIYVLVSVTLLIIVGAIVQLSFPPDFPPRPIQDFRPRKPPVDKNWLRLLFVPVMAIGIPYAISAVLRMYREWKKNEDLRKKVEKEKIQSELQFLKTQLNPHFLFNSLNAIYALSVKNSKETSEAIINLSEMMRYMLYEADKDMVPLTKELEYIKSYVQLQRLRLADSENVTLNISGEDKNKAIPPLLFISFIENAFKYGTDYQGRTTVKINLIIDDDSIHLSVMNLIGIHNKEKNSFGVGLENVRNRLKLLYPNAHVLKVKNDGETYSVNLVLNQ